MDKTCKCCNKKVVNAVCCVNCRSAFHPSCAQQAKFVSGEDKVICCKQPAKSEVGDKFDPKTMENLIENLLKKHLSTLKMELQSIYHTELTELKQSVQYMSDVFEDMKMKNTNTLRELQTVKSENEMLKKRIDDMETLVNKREQTERKNNIIISGIGRQPGNDKDIVRKMGDALKVKVDDDMIDCCYRIKNNDNAPLLVKFRHTQIKQDLLRKIREMKGLKTDECGMEGPTKNIYINEDLTPYNQRIFKEARELVKQRKIKKTFCVRGVIYIQCKESDSSKAIYNLSVLQSIN